MNILRKRRKSRSKMKLNKFMIVIFSLVMTTFAWFAYTKILNTTLKMHIASWDMAYYRNGTKIQNPEKGIEIGIGTLYPTMPEQTVTIDIKNNGETMVDIEYEVKSVTIAGITFELVEEGKTNTTDNYIVLAPSVLTTDKNTGKKIYKNAITNDISKLPFTVEVEHSSQIVAATTDASGQKTSGTGYLKVTVNWMGDNDELDSKWGYLVGNNPTAKAMTIVLDIETYQTDLSIEEKKQAPLPSNAYTTPYMPTGFTRVPGTTLDSGLAIQDSDGNQYVWVEVPRTTGENGVYKTAGLSITSFTDAEYTKIENDLHTYTSVYRNGTSYTDTYYSDDTTGLTSTQYTELKQKMLKSVYQNGGFYVGRYETGIEDAPRNKSITQTPVIKRNAYPYSHVTCSQAQSLASSMESGEYTSSLMFGVQWDLVLKYLETKAVEKGVNSTTIQAELKTDSRSWGNYINSLWNITNLSSKYAVNGLNWTNGAYAEKKENEAVQLSTGASDTFCKQGIYDLVGNISEWTLEYTSNTSKPCVRRGGDFWCNGNINVGSHRFYEPAAEFNHTYLGFRVSLY